MYQRYLDGVPDDKFLGEVVRIDNLQQAWLKKLREIRPDTVTLRDRAKDQIGAINQIAQGVEEGRREERDLERSLKVFFGPPKRLEQQAEKAPATPAEAPQPDIITGLIINDAPFATSSEPESERAKSGWSKFWEGIAAAFSQHPQQRGLSDILVFPNPAMMQTEVIVRERPAAVLPVVSDPEQTGEPGGWSRRAGLTPHDAASPTPEPADQPADGVPEEEPTQKKDNVEELLSLLNERERAFVETVIRITEAEKQANKAYPGATRGGLILVLQVSPTDVSTIKTGINNKWRDKGMIDAINPPRPEGHIGRMPVKYVVKISQSVVSPADVEGHEPADGAGSSTEPIATIQEPEGAQTAVIEEGGNGELPIDDPLGLLAQGEALLAAFDTGETDSLQEAPQESGEKTRTQNPTYSDRV